MYPCSFMLVASMPPVLVATMVTRTIADFDNKYHSGDKLFRPVWLDAH